jgi:hypothetical protein
MGTVRIGPCTSGRGYTDRYYPCIGTQTDADGQPAGQQAGRLSIRLHQLVVRPLYLMMAGGATVYLPPLCKLHQW